MTNYIKEKEINEGTILEVASNITSTIVGIGHGKVMIIREGKIKK